LIDSYLEGQQTGSACLLACFMNPQETNEFLLNKEDEKESVFSCLTEK